MENHEIARLLSETADLMEIAGEDSFRIRSYRNAAGVIEGYPERISDILKDPTKKVTDIPGIGKGIASVLEEIEKRGSFERRDQMLEKYPPTALELLKIQGLGPKSIRLLFDHFRVSTIDDLEKICQEQKLQTLPRMGAKLEEKVLRVDQPIPAARGAVPAELRRGGRGGVDGVSEGPGVRRDTGGQPAARQGDGGRSGPAGDGPEGGGGAGQIREASAKVDEVLGHGPNKASARFGLEGDAGGRAGVAAGELRRGLQYFTGSKEHNVALRARAQKMGLTLNEYALARVDGGARVARRRRRRSTRRWACAGFRRSCARTRARSRRRRMAVCRSWSKLGDIRGDLHMHTRESDGRATLEEMAEAAQALGYEYIAITDHSKALAMANGLDEKRAVEFAHQVRELNAERRGIRVFSGLECDILRDGTMDLSDDALAELDFVVGSVHSYMNLEAAEMTDRLLRALECPHLQALGHPTGRILLHRDAYPFDFERWRRRRRSAACGWRSTRARSGWI